MPLTGADVEPLYVAACPALERYFLAERVRWLHGDPHDPEDREIARLEGGDPHLYAGVDTALHRYLFDAARAGDERGLVAVFAVSERLLEEGDDRCAIGSSSAS